MDKFIDMTDAFGRKRSIWWNIRQRLPFRVQDTIFNIRMAYQRVVRGFDDTFWWGHCHASPVIMVKMFDEFIKYHCGYPMMFECKHNKKSCDCGNKKWEAVLVEMRDGFQAAVDIENLDIKDMADFRKEHALLVKKFEKGMKLYVKHYFSLWD